MNLTVNARKRIERIIARRIVLDAIAAGYKININNGGETHELPEPSTNARQIMSTLFATDDERLLFYKGGKRVGWVWLVYGNDGWDVVCDYTVNLEHIMAGANALSDKYQG